MQQTGLREEPFSTLRNMVIPRPLRWLEEVSCGPIIMETARHPLLHLALVSGILVSCCALHRC